MSRPPARAHTGGGGCRPGSGDGGQWITEAAGGLAASRWHFPPSLPPPLISSCETRCAGAVFWAARDRWLAASLRRGTGTCREPPVCGSAARRESAPVKVVGTGHVGGGESLRSCTRGTSRPPRVGCWKVVGRHETCVRRIRADRGDGHCPDSERRAHQTTLTRRPVHLLLAQSASRACTA